MAKSNGTAKATVAPVRIGNLVIEGMMLPSGTFGIAVPQISDLFLNNRNTASRDLKRLCGKEFRPSKITTELGNQKINWISLGQFELVVAKLDRAGNKKAQDFRDDLVGISLEQEFSRAFGVKFEEEDFQEKLIQRQLHRELFHPDLTYWWKLDGLKSGMDYAKRVNEFKRTFNLPVKPVDEYTPYEIAKLNTSYSAYSALRRVEKAHHEALALLSK